MPLRPPGIRTLGRTGHKPELVLSNTYQHKVITIDFDFPGYRYFQCPTMGGALGVEDAGSGIIPANTIYFKHSTSGLFIPLMTIGLVNNAAAVLTEDSAIDTYKLTGVTGTSTELVRFWDVNAVGSAPDVLGAWASGAADRSRNIASMLPGVPSITLNGAPTLVVAGDDALACGAGVENMGDYVIVEHELNMRTDAKPTAVTDNLVVPALYTGRINQQLVEQFRWPASGFPATLKAAIPHYTQRFVWDDVG